MAIIFIHRLAEIETIADVMALRDGKNEGPKSSRNQRS